MAYFSQEHKAKLAPTVKAILKKYGLKGSVAVSNHMTFVLTIKSGRIDFINNYNETVSNRYNTFGGSMPPVRCENYLNVNTYWVDDHFTGEAKDALVELVAAMKGPDFFDKSDAMTDYFHVSHYIDINVGRWNKPYVVGE